MSTTSSLKGKTALVTGASSGIGQACARSLAAAGSNLILLARRSERLEALAAELKSSYAVTVAVHSLDVRNRSAVEQLAAGIQSAGTGIDILVNNAGLARGMEKMHEGLVEDWEEMIDTNIKGLLYMTRNFVPLMLESSAAPLVINIGSTAAIQAYAGGGVYCGTKAAVGFIGDGLRIDTVDTPLRVCTIRPGMVETEFSRVRFHGDDSRAGRVYEGIEALKAEDVADALMFVCTRPAAVQISEITLMPTAQASGTVVHRKQP